MKKLLTLAFVLLATALHAQNLTGFALKNVIDDKTVSLSDFTESPGIVILFTSVACPFDGYYTNRLKQLQNSYADKIPLLLVNSYTEAPEGEEWMKKTAEANGITLAYLSDKEQVLMTQLTAQRSPEAFVLKNNNGQFSAVYHGVIDDNAQAEGGVKQAYLKAAIESLLAGKVIATPTTRTVGCYVRKKS
jgi:peroxiredoxin